MIESLWTLQGAARRLGISTDRVRRVAAALGLPRRTDRDGQHLRRRRVFVTSDLEAITVAVLRAVTERPGKDKTHAVHARRR